MIVVVTIRWVNASLLCSFHGLRLRLLIHLHQRHSCYFAAWPWLPSVTRSCELVLAPGSDLILWLMLGFMLALETAFCILMLWSVLIIHPNNVVLAHSKLLATALIRIAISLSFLFSNPRACPVHLFLLLLLLLMHLKPLTRRLTFFFCLHCFNLLFMTK